MLCGFVLVFLSFTKVPKVATLPSVYISFKANIIDRKLLQFKNVSVAELISSFQPPLSISELAPAPPAPL
jgi:hypothetical protein